VLYVYVTHNDLTKTRFWRLGGAHQKQITTKTVHQKYENRSWILFPFLLQFDGWAPAVLPSLVQPKFSFRPNVLSNYKKTPEIAPFKNARSAFLNGTISGVFDNLAKSLAEKKISVSVMFRIPGMCVRNPESIAIFPRKTQKRRSSPRNA